MCDAGTPGPLKTCDEGEVMCQAEWTGEVLKEKKCGDYEIGFISSNNLD